MRVPAGTTPRADADMRVAELTAFHVRIPLRKPFRHASHTRSDTDNVLVRCVLDDGTAGHHRMHAVRAHLREMAGDVDGARAGYREAARRTSSLPEQRYLEARAARLLPDAPDVTKVATESAVSGEL